MKREKETKRKGKKGFVYPEQNSYPVILSSLPIPVCVIFPSNLHLLFPLLFHLLLYLLLHLLFPRIGLLTATVSSEVFKAAQPALLYLVPFTLLPLLTMAYIKVNNL